MADRVVVVREFNNEFEAGIAKTVLEANGVPAQVLAQNPFDPGLGRLGYLPAVKLLVHADDVARAKELLDTPT